MNSEATAYHEAGHIVTAWRHGVKIKRATIVPAGDYHGAMDHENPLKGLRLDIDGTDRANLRVEKAIRIYLAGPAAQRRYDPRSWRAHHGESDHRAAFDLAQSLQRTDELAMAYLKWLDFSVRADLERDWMFVSGFAKTLLEKGSIEPRQIQEIITQIVKG
jgi:hypothetical protein